MLLIRELARVAADLFRFTMSTGRVLVLVAIVLAGIAALLLTTVTVVGPVVLYPLI